MRVAIDEDEYFPFYDVTTELEVAQMKIKDKDKEFWDTQLAYEIDGRTLRRWQRVMAEFYKVQDEIGQIKVEVRK